MYMVIGLWSDNYTVRASIPPVRGLRLTFYYFSHTRRFRHKFLQPNVIWGNEQTHPIKQHAYTEAVIYSGERDGTSLVSAVRLNISWRNKPRFSFNKAERRVARERTEKSMCLFTTTHTDKHVFLSESKWRFIKASLSVLKSCVKMKSELITASSVPVFVYQLHLSY